MFTRDERSQLLAEYFQHKRHLRSVTEAYEEGTEWHENAVEEDLDRLTDRVRELNLQYRDGLPVMSLSRCPYTGTVWRHSFDPYGLDGMWWDFDQPMRLNPEALGGRHLCFTGAVRLAEPVEAAPFTCRPGPAVPFIVKRLMDYRGVKAVLSQVSIGRHTGYLIVYFAHPMPEAVNRTNDWGIEYAMFPDGQGGWDVSEFFDNEQFYDFDLEKWIRSGRLVWIEPGDVELRLRDTVEDCPFLHLTGRQIPCRIQEGEVWWPKPDAGREEKEASWT